MSNDVFGVAFRAAYQAALAKPLPQERRDCVANVGAIVSAMNESPGVEAKIEEISDSDEMMMFFISVKVNGEEGSFMISAAPDTPMAYFLHRDITDREDITLTPTEDVLVKIAALLAVDIAESKRLKSLVVGNTGAQEPSPAPVPA